MQESIDEIQKLMVSSLDRAKYYAETGKFVLLLSTHPLYCGDQSMNSETETLIHDSFALLREMGVAHVEYSPDPYEISNITDDLDVGYVQNYRITPEFDLILTVDGNSIDMMQVNRFYCTTTSA